MKRVESNFWLKNDQKIIFLGGIIKNLPVTSRWSNIWHLVTKSISPPLVMLTQCWISSLDKFGHVLATMANPRSVNRSHPFSTSFSSPYGLMAELFRFNSRKIVFKAKSASVFSPVKTTDFHKSGSQAKK